MNEQVTEMPMSDAVIESSCIVVILKLQFGVRTIQRVSNALSVLLSPGQSNLNRSGEMLSRLSSSLCSCRVQRVVAKGRQLFPPGRATLDHSNFCTSHQKITV